LKSGTCRSPASVFVSSEEASWTLANCPDVNVAKSLWTAIQGDPVFMRRVNGWLAVFWVAMIPISYELGWLKSVAFVSALSLWALVSGHWSAWQAARVEVEQHEELAAQEEHPVEERVVDKMVERTDVERADTEDDP
jgi:hypothetical protein